MSDYLLIPITIIIIFLGGACLFNIITAECVYWTEVELNGSTIYAMRNPFQNPFTRPSCEEYYQRFNTSNINYADRLQEEK